MLKGQVGASDLFKAVTRCKDRAALEETLKGMDGYEALTGPYKAPVQLEERADYAAAAKPGGNCHAVPVDVVLASSPTSGGAAAAASASSSSSNGLLPSVSVLPARPPTNRDRKRDAKQKRKNREGRAQDLIMQQQQNQQAQQHAPAAVAASAPSPALPPQPAVDDAATMRDEAVDVNAVAAPAVAVDSLVAP
jgi:hypothetical protein